MEAWKVVLLMWDARNKEYFGTDTASQVTKEKIKLLQEAQYLKCQGQDYSHFDMLWLLASETV